MILLFFFKKLWTHDDFIKLKSKNCFCFVKLKFFKRFGSLCLREVHFKLDWIYTVCILHEYMVVRNICTYAYIPIAHNTFVIYFPVGDGLILHTYSLKFIFHTYIIALISNIKRVVAHLHFTLPVVIHKVTYFPTSRICVCIFYTGRNIHPIMSNICAKLLSKVTLLGATRNRFKMNEK